MNSLFWGYPPDSQSKVCKSWVDIPLYPDHYILVYPFILVTRDDILVLQAACLMWLNDLELVVEKVTLKNQDVSVLVAYDRSLQHQERG